jgi:hypothetical protein
MLDRLGEFRQLAKTNGISLNLGQNLLGGGDEESGVSNDVDLISDFLVSAKSAIKEINKMDNNNDLLKEIADRQMNENVASVQAKNTEDFKNLIEKNQKSQKEVMHCLDLMKRDHEVAAQDKEEKGEPETRVKKTVKDVIGQKFRDVLRKSQ